MVPELKRAELSQKLSMPVLVAAMVAFALLGSTMRAAVDDSDALSTAGTIFAGVFVQALPFLALGVLLSALIAVFVTPDRLARWLPKRPAAAVLVAAAGGAARDEKKRLCAMASVTLQAAHRHPPRSPFDTFET